MGRRERELKLAPPPGFRLPELDLPGLTAESGEPLLLQATYYDTPDLRLSRWGASLRYRNDEGWLVKVPAAARDGLLTRTEHRFAGNPGAPPPAALDLVAAFVRAEPMAPVARLRTLRRRIGLTDADGKPVAEVVDDEVSVLEGRRIAARFRELEVELEATAPNRIAEQIADRLRRAGAAAADPVPKVVRALGARALDAPDVPPPAGDDDRVAAVVRDAIAGSVRRLLLHDPGVRLGDDPEDVHQARVATRRLRSDLRTFGGLLDREWVDGLRSELRWLGSELGGVRDADVQLARLRERIAELPTDDQPAAQPFVHALEARRDDARVALLAALRAPRCVELYDRLVAAARAPRFAEPSDGTDLDAPGREVLPALARKPWRRLRRAVRSLPAEPTDQELHRVRILAKRTRYAAEAVAPAVGPPARDLARALARLQDVLGEHQDAVVGEAWIRALHLPGHDAAFAAGELVARERAAAAAARAAWPAAWRAVDRTRGRRWLRA